MEPVEDHVFSNGLYLANLAVSSNILTDSWNAVSKHQGDDPTNIIEDHPDYNIIAFVSSPVTTSYHQEKIGLGPEISDFQFPFSETHQSFSVNEAAFSLFNSLRTEFPRLQNKVKTSFKPEASNSSAKKNEKKEPIPFIITGHCLNRSMASLFTFSNTNSLFASRLVRPSSGTLPSNKPYCAIQHGILASLHVVHKDDCVPRLFLGPPTTGQISYKPCGTFLVCSEPGWACFQTPDSVIELLTYKGPGMDSEDQESRTFDYEEFIKCLERMPFPSNGSSFLGHEADSFKAGITAQVTAIGLWQSQVTDLDYVMFGLSPYFGWGVLSGESVTPF